MRGSTFLIFLIVYIQYSICQLLEHPNTQANSQDSYKNPQYNKNRFGQAEFFDEPKSRLRQEFLYPSNFKNAYQYQYPVFKDLSPSVKSDLRRTPSVYNSNGNTLLGLTRPSDLRDSQRFYEHSTEAKQQDHVNNIESNEQEKSQSDVSDVEQVAGKTENKAKIRATNDRIREFQKEQRAIGEKEKFDFSVDNENVDDVERRKSVLDQNNVNYRTAQLQANEDEQIPIALPRQYQEAKRDRTSFGDVYFVAIVACLSTVAIFGVIAAGYCFHKIQQSNQAAADVDYPAYGVVGPAAKETSSGNISPSGDRKLAQSAQMYHYHHQKQQMIASEKASTNKHTSASDADSDEENEEGEYTVYECPGLAPTCEMEVKNPLFQDDITPVSSSPGNVKKDK